MFATQRGVVPAARCALAVSTGKAVRGGVRRLGRGSGSSLPGVVALAIDPGMLAGVGGQIRRGAVVGTGGERGGGGGPGAGWGGAGRGGAPGPPFLGGEPAAGGGRRRVGPGGGGGGAGPR